MEMGELQATTVNSPRILILWSCSQNLASDSEGASASAMRMRIASDSVTVGKETGTSVVLDGRPNGEDDVENSVIIMKLLSLHGRPLVSSSTAIYGVAQVHPVS